MKDINHTSKEFLQLETAHQQALLETRGEDIIWQAFTPEIREKYGEVNRLYASAGVRQVIDAQLAAGVHPNRCRNDVGKFLEVAIDRRKKENKRNGDMVESVVRSYWFYKIAVQSLVECRASEYLWGVEWSLHPNARIPPNAPCDKCARLDGHVWHKDDSSVLLPVLDSHLDCNCFLNTITSEDALERGLAPSGKPTRRWWKFW